MPVASFENFVVHVDTIVVPDVDVLKFVFPCVQSSGAPSLRAIDEKQFRDFFRREF